MREAYNGSRATSLATCSRSINRELPTGIFSGCLEGSHRCSGVVNMVLYIGDRIRSEGLVHDRNRLRDSDRMKLIWSMTCEVSQSHQRCRPQETVEPTRQLRNAVHQYSVNMEWLDDCSIYICALPFVVPR